MTGSATGARTRTRSTRTSAASGGASAGGDDRTRARTRARTGTRTLATRGLGALAAPTEALDHIIGDDVEEGTQLPVELGADGSDDLAQLILGEVDWQGANGLNEVVGLDSAVSGVAGGGQLEERSRFIFDDLKTGAWV